MRVLFDSYAFRFQPFGGISRYFAQLMSRLPGHGIAPMYFFPAVANEHATSTRLSWGTGARFLARHRRIREKAYSVLLRTDKLLARYGRYDLWHRTYYDGIPRARGPVACTVVDMIPELFPGYFTTNPHFRKREIAESATLIFSISEATTRDLVAIYGTDRGKVVTTPLGIDPGEFQVSATPNPFVAPYVLFVGQRTAYKNFQRLARAVVPILTRHPAMSLALVGGGPLTSEEKSFFEAAGVITRVHQASVSDAALPNIYASAELFVFPSEYEGFGLPLLEAFVAGCPTAASRAGSLPEVGGPAVEYFDPTSVDEMSHAIDRIIESRARANELRTLGAQRIPLFTWDRTTELTAQAYRRLS